MKKIAVVIVAIFIMLPICIIGIIGAIADVLSDIAIEKFHDWCEE